MMYRYANVPRPTNMCLFDAQFPMLWAKRVQMQPVQIRILHQRVQTLFWAGYRTEIISLILILGALYFGSRRDAGFRSKTDHGPLLALGVGIERGGVPLSGVQLYIAPGTRGPRRQSNFTWLSIFISL